MNTADYALPAITLLLCLGCYILGRIHEVKHAVAQEEAEAELQHHREQQQAQCNAHALLPAALAAGTVSDAAGWFIVLLCLGLTLLAQNTRIS